MLVGASYVLDLRLLGVSRNVPLVSYRWVFPTIGVGLILNIVTGVLLFIKNATRGGQRFRFSSRCAGRCQRAMLLPFVHTVNRSGTDQSEIERQRAATCHRIDSRVDWRDYRGSSSRVSDSVNLAHLHLIMNHVPTVGSVAALGLLLLGYARRNEQLKHVGLEVLFVIAVLTLPVYVSGVAAY